MFWTFLYLGPLTGISSLEAVEDAKLGGAVRAARRCTGPVAALHLMQAPRLTPSSGRDTPWSSTAHGKTPALPRCPAPQPPRSAWVLARQGTPAIHGACRARRSSPRRPRGRVRWPGRVWGQDCAGQGEALHAGAARWSRQWVLSAAAMLRPLTTIMGGALWGVAGVCESPRGQLCSARGGQG